MEKKEDSSQDFVDKDQKTWKKVLKTILLINTWICIGLCAEITGPTLKDLKLRADSNYEDVSRAISGRSVGFFIGAAIGGLLVDKFPRFCNLMIGVSLCGEAGSTLIAPYAPNTSLLWFLFTLQGMFEGIINIAGQKLILETWLEKASSPMHALHLGFGIGSFIVPEICNPFLAVVTDDPVYSFNASFLNSTSPTTQIIGTTETVVKESRIEWPYLIVAVITICQSLIFYGYQFCSSSTKVDDIIQPNNDKLENSIDKQGDIDKSIDESNESKSGIEMDKLDSASANKSGCGARFKSFIKLVDPGTCTGNRRLFGVQIFGLLFIYFFNAVGGERIFGKFIRTYAIDQLHFSNDDATLLNTTFWISFSLGRFTGFVAARWIPIRVLIVIEATGALISAILLNIFGWNNSTMLWVFTQPMGFFIAPMFPSGIGWGDFHVEMTGVAITFLLFGGSLGGVVNMWIIGYIYDNFGYRSFMYHVLAYGIAAVVFAYTMHFSTWGNKGRFYTKSEEKYEEEKETVEEKGL